MAQTAPREARLLPFVGPLLVGYLVVELLATASSLDGVSVALLVVAAAGALSPRWFLRAAELKPVRTALSAQPTTSLAEGRRRLSWLGLSTAAVAVARASGGPVSTNSILLEVVGGVAAPWIGALAVDLALVTPDRLGRARAAGGVDLLQVLRAIAYVGAGLVSIMELARSSAALTVDGVGLVLVPHTAGWVTVAFVVACTLGAIGARLARRGGASEPESLAANASALAGLAATLLVGVVAIAVIVTGTREGAPELRALVAAALGTTLLGHLAMTDDARPVRVARTLRTLVAATASLGLAAALAVLFRSGALARAGWTDWAVRGVGVALVAAGTFAFLRALADRVLAPDAGRLLEALGTARERLATARSLEQMAEAVLPPLRRAAREPGEGPRLVCFDPPREARVDAAGVGHVETRAFSAALTDRLTARPGEVVVARPVVESAVRRPELRALVGALQDLDALVVVPLTAEAGPDALEGALVIPRGARRAAVTLEEIADLERLGRELGVRLAGWAAAARAQERAGKSMLAVARLEERVAALEDELADRGGKSEEAAPAPLFAYAPRSRAALRALDEAAPRDTPLLVVVERGTPAEPWVRRAHEQGPRAGQPLVWIDCAELAEESAEPRVLAALRQAGRGTLVLADAVALPLAVQSRLSEAIATRTVQIGAEAHPLWCRIVATASRPWSEGAGEASRAGVEPELARRFAAQTIVVPPLLERQADVRSLTLRGIERACRRRGRDVLGIEDDALRWLETHAVEDGERGLLRAVERAVEHAVPPRIRVVDLERALAAPGTAVGEDPLDATLAEVEERALLRALDRAKGNKSEAARLLGLKRTTFLDKIRRLGLDDGPDRPSA
ncbi:MAG: helix-turn-helix domain-containing protein [Sandaracinus sp.]